MTEDIGLNITSQADLAALNRFVEALRTLQSSGGDLADALEGMRSPASEAEEAIADVAEAAEGAAKKGGGLIQSYKDVSSVFQDVGRFVQAAQEIIDGTVGAYVRMADDVGDVAKITGDSTEDVSRLTVGLGSLGLSIDQLNLRWFNTNLSEMNAQIKAGKEPTSDFARAITTMDIPIRDANGELRTMVQMFPEIVAALNTRFPDGADRSAAATAIFGRAADELNDILELTPEQLQKAMDKAEEFGLVLSEQDVAAADRIKKQVLEAEQNWELTKLNIGKTTAPIAADFSALAAEATSSWGGFFDVLSGHWNSAEARAARGISQMQEELALRLQSKDAIAWLLKEEISDAGKLKQVWEEAQQIERGAAMTEWATKREEAIHRAAVVEAEYASGRKVYAEDYVRSLWEGKVAAGQYYGVTADLAGGMKALGLEFAGETPTVDDFTRAVRESQQAAEDARLAFADAVLEVADFAQEMDEAFAEAETKKVALTREQVEGLAKDLYGVSENALAMGANLPASQLEDMSTRANTLRGYLAQMDVPPEIKEALLKYLQEVITNLGTLDQQAQNARLSVQGIGVGATGASYSGTVGPHEPGVEFQHGGRITEPIVGRGQWSGRRYTMGEGGRVEEVRPVSRPALSSPPAPIVVQLVVDGQVLARTVARQAARRV